MAGRKPQKGVRQSKDSFISLKAATEDTIDTLSARITDIEEQFNDKLKDQRSENQTIVLGAIIATVLIVVTIAVSVIEFWGNDNTVDQRLNMSERISDLQLQQNDTKNNVDNLKIRNPYLK